MVDEQRIAMTQKEAEAEVSRLQGTYPVVRLLDEQGVETDQRCLLYGDGCPCMRQVCIEVLDSKVSSTKTLRMGDDRHSATARYVEVDGTPHVLLYACPLDAPGPEASEALLYRDALTGIHNRRYYEDHLRHQYLAAGIAMFDLDEFKLINDTLGHAAGDAALCTAASTIAGAISAGDTLVRYGGDEFVLIMPGIASDELSGRLQRIIDALASASVEGYPQVQLGASAGGAMANGRTVEDAVRHADNLMYQAKEAEESVLTEDDSLVVAKKSKPLVLIVDDSEMNRMILCDMLEDEYEIIEADGGAKGIELLEQHGDNIAIVLLDIVMPDMDGFAVLSRMNRSGWIDDIPVVMISAEDSDEVVLHAYELGASDYISRPFDVRVVHHRVGNVMRLYAKQRRLSMMLAQQYYERERDSHMLVDIMGGAMEMRNGESGPHIRHIRVLTEILLERLVQKTDRYHLTARERAVISMASALHDIGKLAIDDRILNKPGRLTDEEFAIMKTHSAAGAEALQRLGQYRDSALVKTAIKICRWHHERYDGHGYPDGLKGEEIPISAQVVSVADVYDALTSERVYKAAYSHDVAIKMILNGECGQFNPLLIECLLDVQDRIKQELDAETTPPYLGSHKR